ncbi:hypothetical protein JAAARDRAFT_176046 [Jaapia argillacea MUCL 33604]|uniref:Phytocyanin domain-containing protein n=1 Tax=Jaapia argillacea MUCL 33604 TaxID=933084 RepID=A0A067PWQ1_9AGAM|nr:hypothetical protein JAAARDRAFT_176046 [Jaapia argillacea MUCL 33604]
MRFALRFAILASVITLSLAAVFDVSVGAGGLLKFDPETVTAQKGDIVNFVFHPKNHTVTQSSFNAPCVPLAGGFNSGFTPVASEGGGLPNFPVTVNDSTTPIWVHCEQVGHCGKGMVFAINAPPDPNPHSFSAFKALAIAINGTNTSTTATAVSTVTVTTTVTAPSTTYTSVYTSYAAPPATSAAYWQPTDHKITVGKDGQLMFNPSNITAAIGDTVTFEFHPKNHTVTQSSFLAPCQPLADTSAYRTAGFNSGFTPVASENGTFPTFQIKINDTAPIWGFCEQTGHCGKGMVFSINAVQSSMNNFAAFQARAIQINGTSITSMASSTSTATTSQYTHWSARHRRSQ